MDLGSHLRAARERRKLTLDVLAARTKIARHLLVDLEANDLSRWPRHQVYRHGFLRAYADAVGLDAEPVIAKFVKEFSEEPVFETVEPPALTVKSPTRSPWWLTAVIAVVAIGVSVAAILLVDAPTPREDRSGVQAVTPQGAAPVTDQIPAEPESSQPTTGVATLPTLPTNSTPTAAEVAPGPEVQNPVFVEGELVIESEPSGAAVVVNGIGRGRTPVRVQYLPLGAHTIRLVLAGYKSQEQSVTLTPTRPARSVTIVFEAAGPR